MSGPPHWLAYAWAASLWVAAGCVGMAGVAAVVDWVTAALGPRTDSLAPLAASQPDCDPESGTAADRASGPPPRPAIPTRTPNPHKPHRHGDPMTLAELRAQLAALNLPDDTIVILAKDAEGNGFSPLVEADPGMYLAESEWSGEHYMTEEQRLAQDEPDDWSQAPDDAVPAVFLWPTN